MIAAPDILSVILRALGFVLLFQAAGTAIFVASFTAELGASARPVRRVGVLAAALAIPVLCLHELLEGARMAGDFSGLLDPSLQWRVLRSPTGESLAMQVAGMGLVILALITPAPRSRVVSVSGALLAAIAFTLTGHTAVHAHRPFLATLLLIHILIAMFWFGALLPLWLVSAREPLRVAGRVADRFSGAAVWIVPGLLLAGVGLGAVLVPGWGTFREPYGSLLLAKLLLFAALMGLAAANKRRFAPGMAAGLPVAASRFRTAVAAETLLICAVLAVTACLTTFFSPD